MVGVITNKKSGINMNKKDFFNINLLFSFIPLIFFYGPIKLM